MLPAQGIRHLPDLAAHSYGELLQSVGMIHGISNPGNHIGSESALLVPGAKHTELFSRLEVVEADGDAGRAEINRRSQAFRTSNMQCAAGGEIPGKIVLCIAQHDGAPLDCRRFAGTYSGGPVCRHQSNGTVAAFPLPAARRIDRKAFPLQNSEQAFSFFKRYGNGLVAGQNS